MGKTYFIKGKEYIFDSRSFSQIFGTKYVEIKFGKQAEARFNKEMFRKEIGDSIGMSSDTIKDWLLGRHDPANKETIFQLADFLKVDPISLLKETERKDGDKKMLIDKMRKCGIKEAKVYKVVEYTLWNDFKAYLKHRIDTANKELYSLFLEDICVCDISPQNAEDEDKFFEIFNEMIDDDCIADYLQFKDIPIDPDIMRKENEDLYKKYLEDQRKKLEECGMEHILTDPPLEAELFKAKDIK